MLNGDSQLTMPTLNGMLDVQFYSISKYKVITYLLQHSFTAAGHEGSCLFIRRDHTDCKNN